MPEREEWSWKRFFGGFIEGRRYGKDFAILVRIGFLITLLTLVIMGGLWAKDRFFGSKPSHSSANKIESNTGTINQVDSHSNTQVTNHYYPLSDIFSWVFGNKQKVVEAEKGNP